MNIEIIANTIANNRVVAIGERIEINPKDGRFLVALGKAVEIVEIENVEPDFEEEVTVGDVKVRRRARKP